MTIKHDAWIRKMALQHGMITPFEAKQAREVPRLQTSFFLDDKGSSLQRAIVPQKAISFGTSSFGYDARIDHQFKVFTPTWSAVVDPKRADERAFVDVNADEFLLLPPHSFALGKTIERFKMPKNVLGICLGKSTYARCGIVVNVTPLEPGWEGIVTVEISNTTPLPARIYTEEGIMQVLFFEGEQPDTTYADRSGKYQNQEGIELARV